MLNFNFATTRALFIVGRLEGYFTAGEIPWQRVEAPLQQTDRLPRVGAAHH